MAAVGEAPLQLVPAGADVQSLSVDAGEYFTVAAWSESVGEERSRVSYIVLRDGRLHTGRAAPEARSFDLATVGRSDEVTVRYNRAKASPGFAWVHAEGDTHTLQFAEGWQPEALASQALITATTNPIEMPSLAFDRSGSPVVAWTEVIGARSEVFAAVRSEGTWKIDRLTTSARPYDLLPQAFGLEAGAEVFWYGLEGDVFLTRKATVTAEGVTHEEEAGLAGIPTEWLPTLYHTRRSTVPGAYWMRPTENGQLVQRLPARPGARGIEEPFGRGITRQLRASVSRSDHAPMAGLLTDGALWWIAVEDRGAMAFTIPVENQYAVPALARTQNAWHLFWHEDASEGGDGSLWYLRKRAGR
jgi:hypothetical protein